MAQWLKQSTAFTFQLGPFLDSVDGVTAEAALTIAATDVDLSKTGGAFADKGDATALTSTGDAQGYYDCVLSTTDTGTLGTLDVRCYVAGALPVWKQFMVVPANVWDSMFGASKLLVDLDTIKTQAVTCGAGVTVLASVGTAATSTAQTGDNFVRLGAAGAGLTAVPWNATWDAEVQSECNDAIIAAALATAAELAKVPKSDSTVSWNATAKAALAVAFLDSLLSAGDADALNARTIRSAFRVLRNMVDCATTPGTQDVKKEDDTTTAWTAALTSNAAADPITKIDPA